VCYDILSLCNWQRDSRVKDIMTRNWRRWLAGSTNAKEFSGIWMARSRRGRWPSPWVRYFKCRPLHYISPYNIRSVNVNCKVFPKTESVWARTARHRGN